MHHLHISQIQVFTTNGVELKLEVHSTSPFTEDFEQDRLDYDLWLKYRVTGIQKASQIGRVVINRTKIPENQKYFVGVEVKIFQGNDLFAEWTSNQFLRFSETSF